MKFTGEYYLKTFLKESKMNNLKRRYIAAFIEGNEPTSLRGLSIDEIVNNKQEYESFYAMEENMDAILDLLPGDLIQMNFNRDDKTCVGFIKRIS